MINTNEIKTKIFEFLRTKGPTIPIYIAQHIGKDMLITSAILSEMNSEKKIKMSKMKVGSSPIYFLNDQIEKLEEFSKHLKSKEKEAFEKLQKEKILEDEKQNPAIRIALREIRDFAIPFKKDEKIFWRYFKNPEEENQELIKDENKEKDILNKKEFPEAEKNQQNKQEKEIKFVKKKKVTKKKLPKSTTERKNEKFFNKIKEFLSEKNIEMTGIEGFTKDSLTLKIKENSEEKLMIAYNKKRITENEVIKAHKKALEKKMKYMVLSLGEPTKKMNEFIEAIKDLSDLKKIE